MCIVFWYQFDGTTNKIEVSGPADYKSEEDDNKTPMPTPVPPTPEKEATPEPEEINFLDPNYAAGLEAASDYSESFDGDNPLNKVLHKYKLIVAANRDEYLDRKAVPLHFWTDSPEEVVAGKDAKDGGTWLGLSRKNKCAATILNKYTKEEAGEGEKSSRGQLCLTSLKKSKNFARRLRKECSEKKYSPFFLLSFDFEGPLHCSYYTCGEDGELKHKEITGSGFCSHSNSSMERPWMKTTEGLKMFEKGLTESLERTAEKSKMQMMRDLKAELLKLLKHEERFEDPALRENYEGSSVLPKETKEDLSLFSSIFVKSKCEKVKYGTRVHSLLIVDQKNDIYFIETNAKTGKEEYYRFNCQ